MVDWTQTIATATATTVATLVAASTVIYRQKGAELRIQRLTKQRKKIDKVLQETQFELKIYLQQQIFSDDYSSVADVYHIAHRECTQLLLNSKNLSWTDRILLKRFCRQMYGSVIFGSVDDLPRTPTLVEEFTAKMDYTFIAGEHRLETNFRTGNLLVYITGGKIGWMFPNSDDPGPALDFQGRGIVNVFRLSIGDPGKQWPDPHLISLTASRIALRNVRRFRNRKWFHIAYRFYRTRAIHPLRAARPTRKVKSQ
ncbi:hypothetical protein [Amycolatopsis sp. lyj-90]|uniref:hypothetical protein n=1 Tax=Amycolatopsis sp. lyj-90 TaxID=2789285 RepID=UPI00397ABB7E